MSDPTRSAEHERRIAEFTGLFAKTQQKLYVFIVAMGCDTTEAYDVLQDTNLALWQHFDRYESGTNFFAWAREVARYRVLRHWQVVGSRPQRAGADLLVQVAAEAADESEQERDERLAALRGCVAKLPDSDREIVEARYGPGGTLRGLAKAVGRSENALSQSLRRIRSRLATCVEKQMTHAETALS